MRQAQRGQSMAGFLVSAAFILLPAFIALSLLAKTGDMTFRAREASRYAAWEKTVWKSESHAKGDGEIGWEVRNRVFARGDAAIDSEKDKLNQDNQSLDTMAYTTYGEQRGRQPLLADLSDSHSGVQVTTSALAPGGTLARLNERAASVLKLESKGYRQATVEVPLIRANPDYLPLEPLTLDTRYVLLDDAWNAGSPQRARDSIRRLVPTALLDNEVIRTVQSIVGFVFDDLSPENFQLGKVDVEVAPCQRLARYERGKTDAPKACLE
ncbi:hypothetical protein [Alloalcanivorax gelatiniphagus]|uniref:Pilus assembly protein n=1 Tax=Alloalcanivorax gelatiniphagus TaxID=1194167 RepID=A0ABY2XHZ4_9GAMM|nr:hypothetical protein [Alloalcanivorax gelatiniphagus]TMW11371.1 hypothetical protein FGS76_15075 [Alloalcanivorax gelatiniphagus]